MTPPSTQDAGVSRPALQSWRTTTAVRVFALALATGTVLSRGDLVTSAPMLVVLCLVAAVSSLFEWMTRNRPTHWHAVGEAVAVTMLLISTSTTPELGAYLAVAPIAAGVRHGLVTALNVTLVSGLTAAVAASPQDDALVQLGGALPWLVIGLGVGLLAGWQSRSTRDLAARQAPYAAAHHLMARIHHLASSGSLGLNSASLAMELDAAMRAATGGARSTIFVVEPDHTLRPLNGGDDVDRMRQEIELPDPERTPGAAVVPLRGVQQVLGYCVVVGVPRWTPELDERAQHVADEFAVRLDTAVLFDEVRSLATSEERNRIAREMHDGVAQEIVGLGYIVDEIESISDQQQTRELASALRAEITRLVSEIRFSIFDLRHEVSDGRLSSSLADYAREVGHATGLRVHLSLAESGPPLPSRTATEVLRVAQEAIGNVRKHSRATNMWVVLDSDGARLSLEVSDDGIGNAEPREHHWGLQTMRERARTVGADLDITTRPDGGTVVSLRSPVTAPHEGETAHGHHRATG
ncbi:sensor histidine kinase [Nocardioides KLBMP 9356]|uniref:Sensor histidine kinase n=1 Tax=Nocardioides potassii TaxID=2911371 RepID=A0ABS9H7S2_9ACTN|nr:sensor histidine kinase [Nocardioides potassii]MCF6377272.1 sensor histidine kinase [Nocardioides potassii]